MRMSFGVLGPVTAWDEADHPLELKGPRHRAVLARLILARRRVVPLELLIDDLWQGAPPAGATNAVRTFVAALRRALEPDRPPRTPAHVLTTQGPGYALHAAPDSVDAWLFEQRLTQARTLPPRDARTRLHQALDSWRGPAYADFADAPWARAERARLSELRLHALEHLAQTRLDLGQAAQAVPDLEAHVAEHPWREDAWRLLALALYRTDRQGDALAVLRRARTLLIDQLGVDPGPALRRLEDDILHQADHLTSTPPGTRTPETTPGPEQLWIRAADAYQRTVTPGAHARLHSTVGLLRDLAVTGGEGLRTARAQRVAAITAAEELNDPHLTARVIGAYDVPANWTRVDDPEQSERVVAAAERALAALPAQGSEAARSRLLATIALESRGTHDPRAPHAATEAEHLARQLGDPVLLAFALNARYMQTFHRTGLAPERDAVATEMLTLATRHELVNFQILGHLIGLQSRSALADWPAADHHARTADRLATRHERPLVEVFTGLYRALRTAAAPHTPLHEAESGYREATARLHGAGMPGLGQGLEPLALLCLRLYHRQPAPAAPGVDYGPHEPWARPLVLLAQDRRSEATAALTRIPEPPRDLLMETRWCLTARAALALGEHPVLRRAEYALTHAAQELAGAQTGMLTLGPVADHLSALRKATTDGPRL
ncbi:AfsR/SARP family transcriptional regulator [Nocardiopsis nanhaiensis]